MANEYLKRTPISTGNRKVWTWSAWVKRSNTSGTNILFEATTDGTSNRSLLRYNATSDFLELNDSASGANVTLSTKSRRDLSSWTHIMRVFDTPSAKDSVYVNGVLDFTRTATTNADGLLNGSGIPHFIGHTTVFSQDFKGEMADIFFIDGQSLTPDVFGYYKKGDGYISAGSTQATDFKKGQWVPKAPKVIRSVINARGGFGVNGFYLPMNDDSNFGADFHCEPNSIIKLKGENFDEYPQPRNGAPETTDAYVSQLRTDPYAANLVLAMPLISGGKDGGYGDYSADIKGSGSNKSVRVTGAPSVTGINSSLYYGSALVGNNDINNYLTVTDSGSDFRLDPAAEDWTIEFWTNPYARSTPRHTALLAKGSATTNNSFDWRFYIGVDVGIDYDLSFGIGGYSGDDVLGDGNQINLPKDQWHHIVVEARNGVLTEYINGVAVGINTSPRAQTTNHSQLQIF